MLPLLKYHSYGWKPWETMGNHGKPWETIFLLIGDIGDDIPVFGNGDLSVASWEKLPEGIRVSYEVQESKSLSDLPI